MNTKTEGRPDYTELKQVLADAEASDMDTDDYLAVLAEFEREKFERQYGAHSYEDDGEALEGGGE